MRTVLEYKKLGQGQPRIKYARQKVLKKRGQEQTSELCSPEFEIANESYKQDYFGLKSLRIHAHA